jgi:hypothetical protein
MVRIQAASARNRQVRTNRAATAFEASIVTTHVPVPVHAPLHPLNAEPVAGMALSVTTVPFL